jgi:hypothetical protein
MNFDLVILDVVVLRLEINLGILTVVVLGLVVVNDPLDINYVSS